MAEKVRRVSALENRAYEGQGVSLTPAAHASRLSVRAAETSLPALSKALGLDLPTTPAGCTAKGKRAALWLGPDEWLVIDSSGADLKAALANAGVDHAAVDISHRNCAVLVSGERAEEVLNAGCPLDLGSAALPVNAAKRTVFNKAEIVVWRTDETTFHVECWRSFSDYVFTLLERAARETV